MYFLLAQHRNRIFGKMGDTGAHKVKSKPLGYPLLVSSSEGHASPSLIASGRTLAKLKKRNTKTKKKKKNARDDICHFR